MEQLTTCHCLLPIEPIQLTQFKQLYEKWAVELPSLQIQIHNSTDAFAAVLNCWAFSIYHKQRAIFSPEKSISHQTNFYIVDLLYRSHLMKDILEEYNGDSDQLFVFSYYIGFHIMRWVDFVLKQEDPALAETIFTSNNARSYYLLNDQNGTAAHNDRLYIHQKIVTHLLVQDQKERKRFDSIIEKSYSQTKYTLSKQRKQCLYGE